MGSANRIHFWHRELEFDPVLFARGIDKIIQEAALKELGEKFLYKPLDEILDHGLSDEEIKESSLEGYYSIICPPSKSKEIENKRKRLYTLSSKLKMKHKEKMELDKLWEELERENSLIFATPRLRKIAEGKIGLTEVSTFKFFLNRCAPKCNDKILLSYLDSDLSLLQSELVIRYLRIAKEMRDIEFLKNMKKIFNLKPPPKNKQCRSITDWVFVQVYYTQKIEKRKDSQGLKLQVPEICDSIRQEFPNIIKRKLKGFPGGPKTSVIEDWYSYSPYDHKLFKHELKDLLEKCVFPAQNSNPAKITV